MIGVPPRKVRGDGSGVVWPDTGTAEHGNVRDPFGPRPFTAHIATVGYDYDLHRGIDIPMTIGDPIYSPINGSICRWHFSHFGWEIDEQLNQWKEVDPNTSAQFERVAPSTLRVTGSRVGAQSFPTDVGLLEPIYERVKMESDTWEIRINFAANPSIAGRIGVGVYNDIASEWAALEYDGTTFTVVGKDSGGTLTADGTTDSPGSAQAWGRVRYEVSTGTLFWDYSNDADNWTNIASEVVSFSNGALPHGKPVIYYRSLDTDASDDVIDVDFVGWFDDRTIPRFGNWVEITDGNQLFILQHCRELTVDLGDVVKAGEQIGTSGLTGFDTRSGQILYQHVHVEWRPSNEYFHGNDKAENPLAAGIFPRTNVSNNVSVARDSANDPDGTASHRLTITVNRADQDFDVNEITLTGNLATRTVNWDTREGINDDHDIPKNNGMYMVPQLFNEEDSAYVFEIFFNESVVGSTFVSAEIKDSSGVTLWSE